MINHPNSQASREQVTGASSSQPAQKKYGVIKLSLDVHAAKYKVCRQIGDLPLQPVQSFSPEEFLRFARKQLEQADKVYSCYEAGPTGYWLHRRLVEMGADNQVVVPGNLDAYGRKVNTDRTDARRLASKFNRYLAGDQEALAIVRVPSLEAEQRRALSRQRKQFGKVLRSVAAMGRGLALLHGYRLNGPWWRQCRWEKLELPAWIIEHLERFRPTMEEAEKAIRALSKSIRQAAPSPLPVGMGALTMQELDAEIVDWSRFKNRKQPGSFGGVCGGVAASGEQHADLSITKHGNRRIRTMAIELAWRMVFFQPDCHAVKPFKEILLGTRSHARRRKQAIVAVARRLLVDLWRWKTGRATPEQLGWLMRAEPAPQPPKMKKSAKAK